MTYIYPNKVAGESVWYVRANDGRFISSKANSFNETEVQQISSDNNLRFVHRIELQPVPVTLDGEFICSVQYLNYSTKITSDHLFSVSVTGMFNSVSY